MSTEVVIVQSAPMQVVVASTGPQGPIGNPASPGYALNEVPSGTFNVDPKVLHLADGVYNVKDYGAVGDGATDDTTAIQTAVNAASALGNTQVHFPVGVYLSGNITITAVDLMITGPGKINWTGTAVGSNAIGFQLVGTCTQITIENLWLNGDGVIGNRHAGVWTTSGQTLTDITIRNLRITNVVLGVSLGGSTGTLEGVLIEGNHLDTVVGTAAGAGYGLHLDGGTASVQLGGRIVNNFLTRVQRHSIYQARGRGVLIAGNVIQDHRIATADATYKGAIVIGRGADVICVNNHIDKYSDGAIDVFSDTGIVTRNILVADNVLTNAQNAVASIKVGGDTGPATLGTPEQVIVSGNTIYSTGVNTPAIRMFHGKQVKIIDNSVQTLAGTGAVNMITVEALGDSAGTATYTQDLTVSGNTLYGTGSDTRGIRLDSEICTSVVRIDILNNRVVPVGSGVDVYGGASVSNPNISVFGEPHSLTFTGGAFLRTVYSGPLEVQSGVTVATGGLTVTGAGHFINTVTLDDDLVLGDDMTLASGSVLTWAADTTLYRNAADTLKTDDTLVVGGAKLQVDHASAPKVQLTVATTERAYLEYNSTDGTRLDSDGDVAIAPNNTVQVIARGATPTLEVRGATDTTPAVQLYENGTLRGYWEYNGATDVMRLDSDGNIILAPNNATALSFDNSQNSLVAADLKVTTAGKTLFIKEGTNAKMGVSTLVGGTVVVSTTAVTANSRIFLDNQSLGGTAGFLRVSARTAGTSFTILSSSGTDTSVIAWMIVEPA